MINKIRAGIIGGAGYTGGELIRILLNHPHAEITFVQSKSNAGNALSKVHDDLAGQTSITFSSGHHYETDVLFFCAGHGEAIRFLTENEIPASVKIIDIGNDFRLKKDAVFAGRQFVYGLPELNNEAIKKAANIANPGCFATAIQLGLLPLAQNNLLQDVYTTGITGATGAGQLPSASTHFSWRSNNIQAYKTLSHQHDGEISESIFQLQQKDAAIHFVPWRGDFARGIFISSQLKNNKPPDELFELYKNFYKESPFVMVSKDPIHLKQAVNTNNCFIHLEKKEDNLVVHSVIDNLLKGASGQAVQNMNLMFGLDETTGLKLKANYF